MDLPALTEEQQQEKDELVTAYCQFWEHDKFHSGLAVPNVPLEGALPCLKLAAEIVVRIRAHLDESGQSAERLIVGSTGDYLWGICGDPEKAPKAFIRAVVHATLSDAEGYVESLTEAQVEKLIEEYGGKEFTATSSGTVMTFADAEKSMKAKVAQLLEQVETIREKDEDLGGRGVPGLSFKAQLAFGKFCELVSEAETQVAKIRALADQEYEDAEIAKAWEEAFPLPSELLRRKSSRAVKPPEPEQAADVPTTSGEAAEEPVPEQSSGEVEVLKVANEVNLIRGDVASFLKETSSVDAQKLNADPSEALEAVEALEKRCLTFSNDLMNELLVLDGISIPHEKEDARKKRKEQELMGNLDGVMEKLRAEHKKLVEEAARAAEEAAKNAPAEPAVPEVPEGDASAPATATQGTESTAERERQIEKLLSEMWPKLRLQPKFEVMEKPEGLVLVSFIPGMTMEDINITVSEDERGQFLVVQGRRLPSDGDVAIIREQIEIQKQRLSPDTAIELSVEEEITLMLRIAAGTFGTISERMYIPGDYDADKTRVNYMRGVLRIIVPKVYGVRDDIPLQRAARPSSGRQYGTYPYDPMLSDYRRPQSDYRRSQFARPGQGLYRDQDLFW